ncbi:MAG: response regulator [Methanomicrobiaceae archaeon]|nr:response regulator [Methanomicrobiaceae archaeon]
MKGSNILVVEDEMIIAMEIRATLKKLGYNVLGSVINGYDAIQTAGEKRPDLVLMDIRLKGDMDGIEAARKIMELYDIPVIFLTGNSDKTTVERAVELKPAGFLIKPFKERELFGNIEMAIHKHKVTSAIKSVDESDKVSDSVSKTISNINTALISTDTKGFINRANKSAIELIGLDQNKIIGRKIPEIFSTANKPDIDNKQESDSFIVWPDAITIDRIKGENNWETISVSLLSGFVTNEMKDIKDFIFSVNQEKNEKINLKKSETLFVRLMESVNEMVFLVDKKLSILQYNKNFLDFSKRLGVSSFQLTRTIYEIAELSFFVEADEYIEVFRTNTPITKTKRFKTKNKEINYFRISMNPNFDGKEVVYVTTIIDDITPLIHAKEHAKYITGSLADIEESLKEINALVSDINEPLIEIIEKSKNKKDPSSVIVSENADKIAEIIESFEIQRIRYENAIDHIKYIDKTADKW